MASQVRAPRRTYRASAAIAQNLRVVVGSDGRISAAGAYDSEVGVTARPAFAANEEIAVDVSSVEGTTLMTASGAITAGAKVYGAAGGKVSVTAGNANPIGIALYAAANNGLVEVQRCNLNLVRNFAATGAIAAGLRVKLGSDGRITAADADETEIGVTLVAAAAENDSVPVLLATSAGTTNLTADGVVAIGAKVYGADAGKAGTTATSAVPIGIALTAGVLNGSFEVVRRDLTITAGS
jgi:hypothetical protein